MQNQCKPPSVSRFRSVCASALRGVLWMPLFAVLSSGACDAPLFFGLGAIDGVEVPTCTEGEVVLKFSHQSAYGFCPRATDLFSATIVVDESGGHTFCGTGLVEAPIADPSCIESDYEPSLCLVEIPLESQLLTEQQARDLNELLAAIPERICSEDPIATDWCIVSVYEFQGRREQTVCSFGYVNDEFIAAIQDVGAFLGELMHQE